MPAHNALLTTVDAARVLGLAVRSVQLMVDRGELEAWKTPGGHRRISLASVQQWQARSGAGPAAAAPAPAPQAPARSPVVLLIEDSLHFQNLVRPLVAQHQPQTSLHVAGDGVAETESTGSAAQAGTAAASASATAPNFQACEPAVS